MDFRALFPLIGFFWISSAYAIPANSDLQDDGMIEIVYPVEATRPYRERRPSNQMTLQVQYESYAPTTFLSTTVSESLPNTYKAVFNDVEIPMVNFALGWKHNLRFVGLEVAAFYGTGAIEDNRVGESITLDLQKYGVKFGAYLDTLFREPYVAPYVAMQTQIWNVYEESPTLIYERETAYAFGFQAGLLFQLNWIEPDSSLQALNESGLNNTFIDVFVQQSGDTADDGDPRLASDMNWGVGLRLEY